MYPFVKLSHRTFKTPLSYYAFLIDQCFSLKSLNLVKGVHAQLIKVGFNRYTFLGNRCLDIYSQLGRVDDALKVFDEISCKNNVSWNILLNCVLKVGDFRMACYVFDGMPERDVVTWNSMISGFASFGNLDYAMGTFWKMQNLWVRPSGFTYSIMASIVCSAHHGKELHGSMIRSGLSLSNVVLGNSLINMYVDVGICNYALGVFLMMEELDVISWNSLITGFCKLGYGEMALIQFCLMRSSRYSPDEFTCSAVITSCCNLRNLDKGKQIFALCVKMGFLCNTIISSAAIDLFSKCNRLEDSVRLFEEVDQWDSALCNSMISSYAIHAFGEDALHLFVLTLREDIRPTEFTLASVLSCIPILPVEQGTQIHSLVIKSGFELDAIVASSLMKMYAELGFIDHAISIFNNMIVRDLISWNTMIMGLSHSGRVLEAMKIFKELLRAGPLPDRITIAGVLLACNFGGLVMEGMDLFQSMEESYGITPSNEHYACVVDLLCRAGRLDEAMVVTEAMPYGPDSLIWESILRACAIHGDMKLIERVAERLMDLEPQSSLPYLVLARMYEMRGQWEGMVRVRKTMHKKRVKSTIGYSLIGIRNHVYTFKADELQHHGGKDIYLVLRLLTRDMEDEDCFCL